MLVAVLRAHGRSVFTNPSTANISPGPHLGTARARPTCGAASTRDIAVLEMDEGHGAAHRAAARARASSLLTNVMVDQIDRFHDSEMVAAHADAIAARATDAVVVNADDDYLVDLAASVPAGVTVERFGVSTAVLDAAPRGLGYARLAPERVIDTAGRRRGRRVGRTAIDAHRRRRARRCGCRPAASTTRVDAAAALSTARAVLGAGFDVDRRSRGRRLRSRRSSAAARSSTVRGQQVEFVLVQNPASYQLNVDSLEAGTDQVLFAIGSDVRDPSYFWPVDTSAARPRRHRHRLEGLGDSRCSSATTASRSTGSRPDLGRAVDDFLALPAARAPA